MPGLHETLYGRRLLDGHIPKAVAALERIADAQEELAAAAWAKHCHDHEGCIGCQWHMVEAPSRYVPCRGSNDGDA